MYLVPEDLPRLTSYAVVNEGLLRQDPVEVRAEAIRKMAIRLLNEAVCATVTEKEFQNETVFSVDFYLVSPDQLIDIIREAMQDGAFDEIRRQKGLK